MESREEHEGQGKGGEPQWHYKVPLAPRKSSRGKSRLKGAGEGGGRGRHDEHFANYFRYFGITLMSVF